MFERGFIKAFCYFATNVTHLENVHIRAGETAQGLRTLVVLLEDLDSFPSMQMTAHNRL